ncbi:MAG: M20/M25/M40 family metallo-hydrolase [Candidatus Latescibacterota bacterium]
MSLSAVLAQVDAGLPRYITALKELVRIPSVSTGGDPAATPHLRRAAGFLADWLRRLGLCSECLQVAPDASPVVLARPDPLVAGRPTVLIYGHYDVQGVDNPRSAWRYDPFAAVEEDGYLVGRGASDNKGQILAHVGALDACRAAGVELPVNPVYLVEGEEECGSGALSRFVAGGGLDAFAPLLCTVISDSSMYAPEQPSLTLGLRGIAYLEVTVRGPRQDVHSGLFGGIAPNPALALARGLAALVDAEGRVRVPGFYDEIREPAAAERRAYASLPVDEAGLRLAIGAPSLVGEPDRTLLERVWTRPTLDVHYLSAGSRRTVIPAQAVAALSCRLVPEQDPQRILAALQQHLRAHLTDAVEVEFGAAHTACPYGLAMDHPLVAPVLRALRIGFGIEPVLGREGGSIPVAVEIAARTGAPVLLVGFGQRTDNWHGPDERFSLRDYHRGVRTAAALLYELSAA